MPTNRCFDGWRTIALQLHPETSALIGELRASYHAEGREVSSLSRVVADAILQYHADFYAVRSRPSDGADFLVTAPKDNV